MFNFLASFLILGTLVSFGISPTMPITEMQEIAGPEKVDPTSLGIEVTAKSVLVVDLKSGAILFSKNSDEKRSIASITKLMTALVFLENNPGWDEIITVKESDKRNGGLAKLWPEEEVKVIDLFNLTLVSSTNEAAIALARSTSLSEEKFVELMNKKWIGPYPGKGM